MAFKGSLLSLYIHLFQVEIFIKGQALINPTQLFPLQVTSTHRTNVSLRVGTHNAQMNPQDQMYVYVLINALDPR